MEQADEVELIGVQQGGAVQRRARREIAQAEADQRQEEQRDQQQQNADSRYTPANEALPNGLSTNPLMS
jgi:hypothetical protein